jgi:hypothetical protein
LVRSREDINGRNASIQRWQSGRKEGAGMECHRAVSHDVAEVQEKAGKKKRAMMNCGNVLLMHVTSNAQLIKQTERTLTD